MKKNLKRIVLILAAVMVLMTAATAAVSACTTIFVGADRNTEGTPFVCRTEDYGSNMNKMWFISEAGAFKKDSTYRGCPAYGGFEWTWTHDTYRFTYFTNDVLYDGKCPECGEGTPEEPCTHYSYTEFGTNEKGVSVSATETIYGNDKIPTVDPFHDDDWMEANPGKGSGIEETDIPTVILGEAASAREGIELLMDIYETRGAFYASGLFVADQNEVWYIENCSGTQYVAMKLPDDLVFIEPNMAIIGSVDLDDPNVIASDKLIEVAKEADSFVGDEEANVIDFRASYSGRLSRADSRLVEGLTYLNAEYQYTAADLVADNSIFTISNVGEDGAIVPIYTKIKEDRTLTPEDIFGFYHLSTVGKSSNQEIEIFQLFKDRPVEYGTVGWVGVGDMSYGQFVPCYPMLLDSLYEGYQVPTALVTRSASKPDDGFFVYRNRSYYKYPENWRDSYYFSFEGLANLIPNCKSITGTALTEEEIGYIKQDRDSTQKWLINNFVSYEDLTKADDPRALATENMKTLAAKAHKYALDEITIILFVGKQRYAPEELDAYVAAADVPEELQDQIDAIVDVAKDEIAEIGTYEYNITPEKALAKLEALITKAKLDIDMVLALDAALKAQAEAEEAIAAAQAAAEEAKAAAETAAQEAQAAAAEAQLKAAEAELKAAEAQAAAEAARAEAAEKVAEAEAKAAAAEAAAAEAKAAAEAAVAEAEAAAEQAKTDAQAAADKAVADAQAAAEAAIAAAKAEAQAIIDKYIADQAAEEAAAKMTVSGLKVKVKAKKATVTYNATEGATAYQVQMKTGKKWGNLAASTTELKVVSKKLKKGKKYSFRVRTITELNGKTIYGKWSKAKTVKVK